MKWGKKTVRKKAVNLKPLTECLQNESQDLSKIHVVLDVSSFYPLIFTFKTETEEAQPHEHNLPTTESEEEPEDSKTVLQAASDELLSPVTEAAVHQDSQEHSASTSEAAPYTQEDDHVSLTVPDDVCEKLMIEDEDDGAVSHEANQNTTKGDHDISSTHENHHQDLNVTAAHHQEADPESEVVRWNLKMPHKYRRQKLAASDTFLAILHQQHQVEVTFDSKGSHMYFQDLKHNVKCCHHQVKDALETWHDEQPQKQASEKIATSGTATHSHVHHHGHSTQEKEHTARIQTVNTTPNKTQSPGYKTEAPEHRYVHWTLRMPQNYKQQLLGSNDRFLVTLRKQHQLDVVYDPILGKLVLQGTLDKVVCCHDQVKNMIQAWRAQNEQPQ